MSEFESTDVPCRSANVELVNQNHEISVPLCLCGEDHGLRPWSLAETTARAASASGMGPQQLLTGWDKSNP